MKLRKVAKSTNHIPEFNWPQGLAYALPTLSIYFLMGPIYILQGMYAKYFGLSLASIAAVILIARIFDAVSDPLVGYFSDKYFALWGTRKPFVIAGGILFIVSSWFLYVPPKGVSNAYFLGWFIAFYLSYTLFVIPHYAWGCELVVDARQRNILYSLRTLGAFIGTLCFYIIPILPFFESSEFTPNTLKWAVLLSGCLMMPMLYVFIRYVPDPQSHHLKIRVVNNIKNNPKAILASLFRNKPFLIFTCAHISTGFGLGMWFAMLFLFVDVFLGKGSQFALLYAVSYGFGILTLNPWCRLAIYKGKKITWVVGMSLVGLGMIGTGFLSSDSGWQSLLLCMILITSGLTAFSVMVPSLLADLADYGTLKFGTDRSGTYYSVYTLINKGVFAVSGALGFALAGWFEFDPVQAFQSDMAILGLYLVIAWIPLVFVLLSIGFILLIPMDEYRHAIIRRRLANLGMSDKQVHSLRDTKNKGSSAHKGIAN